MPTPEHVEDHDRHADRNRGVGDVEGPEVVRAPVDVDEIDDRAGETRSIRLPAAPPMISARPIRASSWCVRQARRVDPTPISAAVAITAMQHRLEREVGGVEDAERGAGVPHVREVEKPGNDRDAVVQRQRRSHHRLGDLIDDDDQRPAATISSARGRGAAPIAVERHPWIGLGQRVLTALAQAGPFRLARDARHVAPAALAFHAAGALDRRCAAAPRRAPRRRSAPAAARPPTR